MSRQANMTKIDLDEFSAWDFDPKLTEASQILCPECKQWSKWQDWWENETGCEDCGSHATIVCPLCDYGFDHVWGPTFQTRLIEG